jgi:hypothetical protein
MPLELEYAEDPKPRSRSVGTFALLLLVWIIGLASWAIYIALAVIVLVKVL